MATTDEIISDARALGSKIAEHEVAKKLETAIEALQGDVEAQRVLNDFNRHLQALGEKESQRQPIEVSEKQKLEQLQQSVIDNKTLRDFQMAQMDYLDLMRRVDEAINGAGPGAAPEAAAGTGGVHPEVAKVLSPDS